MGPTRDDTRTHLVADLPPSSFAPVMATGILAVAAQQQAHARAASLLLAVAALGLVVCWVLLAWRLLACPRAVARDLLDHQAAPGFFTVVAGTAVVASGAVESGIGGAVPWALFALAAASWIVVVYAFFTALAIAPVKPLLHEGIGGGWLLAVVGTEALAVLGSELQAPQGMRAGLYLFALCAWLLGGVFYTWFITLIVYRTLFFPFAPRDLTPAWWINMGAMAIATLAGAQLALAAGSTPFASLHPFVQAVTLVDWVTATWWLPLLVVLFAWRRFVRREPWRYRFADWSAVFPVAMYAAALHKLGETFDVPLFGAASRLFLGIAVLMWLAAALGFAAALPKSLRRA